MRLLIPLFCLFLIACEPIQFVKTNSVTIKADLFGVSAANENRKVLEIQHNDEGSNDRLIELETGAPIYNLIQLQLWVESSTGILPFAEEFAFLSISSTQQKNNALGSPWVTNRIGDVAVLRVRKDDINLERTQFGSFPTTGAFRRPGSHYLARIENDDRQFPWKIQPNDNRCSPMARDKTWYPSLTGETDCFDLETLAGILLSNISLRVSEGLWDTDESPIELSASGHSLYIVPHVSLERARLSTIPGFGFIYQTEITGFGFHATVQVPVSFHYSNGEMIIDPLSGSDDEFINAERIRVISHSLPADFSLELIHSLVAESIANTELPNITVGNNTQGEPINLPLDQAMKLLIEYVAGSGPTTSESSSLIALPQQRVTLNTTLNNKVMFIPSIEEAYKRAPTGIFNAQVSGNQILIPRTITNDPYNRERVIRISGMVPQTPFELIFLE